MCKIIVKYSDFHAKDIDGHRETCEEGAGFVWFLDGKLNSSIAMKHKDAFDGYNANYHNVHKHKSPFSLFHSRLPSMGDSCQENVQPFVSEKFAFAHNGTVDVEKIMWACAAMGIDFDGSESDSNLMFKILGKISVSTMIALLKITEDNYVLVDKEKGQIHVIGQWDLLYYKIPKGYKRLFSAKNTHSGDVIHIITAFNGDIIASGIDKKEQTTYLGNCGDGYWNEDDGEDMYERRWPKSKSKYTYCYKRESGTGMLCAMYADHHGSCKSNKTLESKLEDVGRSVEYCNKKIEETNSYCWLSRDHAGKCAKYNEEDKLSVGIV